MTDPANAATPTPAAVHPWDAQTYDDRFSFVAELGRELIGLLEPRDGERILDLGCGTGTLTAQLASSGAEVVGVDADPGMIRQARAAFPDLRFAVADGQDLVASGGHRWTTVPTASPTGCGCSATASCTRSPRDTVRS